MESTDTSSLPGRSLAAERFDAFGFDARRVDATLRRLDHYYRYWHRVRLTGADNIPEEGPVIFYGNHAGFNCLDVLMLLVGCRLHTRSQRFVRPLFHRGSEALPLFGRFITSGVGGVLGHPHNAAYLLAKGDAVLTYPEGGHSSARPFARRRRLTHLQQFGDGFLRLAQETGAALVAVATTGCEEAMPTLHLSRRLGRWFGFDDGLYPVVPQSALTLWPSMLGLPLHCFHFLVGWPSRIRIDIAPAQRVAPGADLGSLKRQLHAQLQQHVSRLEQAP